MVTRHLWAYYLTALIVILLDQGTKLLIGSSLPLNSSLQLFSFFKLSHIANTGSAFGLFRNMNLVLTIVSIAVIIYLLYKTKTITSEKNLALLCGLVLGGALGNLADRIFLGAVTDFIDFGFWPAFNVADSALTIGAVGLLWQFRKE